MLKTLVEKGSYHDSVMLMLLTNELSKLDGVKKVQVMMATPANKDIFARAGLQTAELDDATANDMVIVADIEDDALLDQMKTLAEAFFEDQSTDSGKAEDQSVHSWEGAMQKLPDANLAVISIPGAYAALEGDRALDEGLNVFMFSDNVTLEQETALKQKAHAKGLCVMGPDCGTGIIDGVPIAFTNSVGKGAIGIIGASGTGIQELTCIIDRLGEGVTNAIGTGGRDLSEAVGGITVMDMIDAMEQDDAVKVMIVLSKPPAKAVREQIENRLSVCKKPVITLFLGEKPEQNEENFYHCYTLDEAARLAVALVRGEDVADGSVPIAVGDIFDAADHKTIKAYYSGGTLANEAAMLIKDALDLKIPPEKAEGFMLQHDGHVVVDLGDDVYTQGHPHPMIDPAKRIECMEEALDDPTTGVILFDVMLGYGSHADMAGALMPNSQLTGFQTYLKQKNDKYNFEINTLYKNNNINLNRNNYNQINNFHIKNKEEFKQESFNNINHKKIKLKKIASQNQKLSIFYLGKFNNEEKSKDKFKTESDKFINYNKFDYISHNRKKKITFKLPKLLQFYGNFGGNNNNLKELQFQKINVYK